jgi:plastocyanin
MRRFIVAIDVILLLVGMSLLGSGSTRADSSGFIYMENYAFSPSVETIDVGGYVVFTNMDTVDYWPTSDDGSWDAGTVAGVQNVNGITVISGSDSFYFNKVGTFTYHCRIHPYMKGTIIVQNAAPTDTDTPVDTPTLTPTLVPTSTPTSTATATDTATPTDTPQPPPLAIVVKGSLRAKHNGTLRVSIDASSAALSLDSAGTQLNAHVSGVTVAVDGRKVGIKAVLRHKTDSKGSATFKHLHPSKVGSVKLSASKSGYTGASTTLRVRR